MIWFWIINRKNIKRKLEKLEKQVWECACRIRVLACCSQTDIYKCYKHPPIKTKNDHPWLKWWGERLKRKELNQLITIMISKNLLLWLGILYKRFRTIPTLLLSWERWDRLKCLSIFLYLRLHSFKWYSCRITV